MSAIPVPVGPLYGALYFASILSTTLYGVTCLQTFFYYIHYQNEHSRVKSFVAAVWVLGTIHHSLTLSGVYKYIVAGVLDPTAYLSTNSELIILFTALVALTTQGFFVYRIYIFSGRNIMVPALWLPPAVYQLVSSLIYIGKALYSADGVHVVDIAVLQGTFFVGIFTSCVFVAAGVDVILSIFLTYLLVRERARTPMFKSTAHLLQRLTVISVNSGIWTATFAVLTAVLVKVFPANTLFTVFGIPLCQVYCNTLLANLNSRLRIRDETTIDDITVDAWVQSGSLASGGTRSDGRSEPGGSDLGLTSPKSQGIWKTTEVVKFSDLDSASGTFRGMYV